MKGRILAAATAAALLAGAGTAWAAFTQEGGPYTTGSAPYTAYTADFNGDGRLDVATNNGDARTFSVFLRQAGGGFAEEAGSPFSSASSNGAVGDFNGDGRPDFASAGFGGEGIGVLIREPAGGFTTEASRPALGTSIGAIGTADFDGDGRGDLAIANWGLASVSILVRNAANSGFDPVGGPGGTLATGVSPRDIAVADYNRDGRPDLAVVANGSGTVTTLLGNGDGTFTAEGAAVPVGSNPSSIVAGDFDGNGSPDLAVSNSGPGTVSVLLRDAANAGFAEGLGSPIAVGASPVQIAAADFDRNGALDIATASASGLDVLLRSGGGFTRDTPTAISNTPSGVALGDFNGDGVPDAAVSSYDLGRTVNQLTVLLSPAPSQPPPVPTPTATPAPTPSPQPVRNKSVAAERESGTVLIKVKGKFVPLTAGVIVANGSEIDTRKGRVGITTSTGEQADFYDGIFKISQSGGITTVTLSEKLTGCPKAGKSSASAAAKKPKTRKLWGDGKGKFRTKGSYSAATVRGTSWLVQDTCTTTLTRVKSGVVEVRDLVKRKTIVLRKSKSYTARKKR